MSKSAEQMFDEADKKTKKMMFKDYEGAQELFTKAGARFKLDKDYGRAGEAYMRAGDCAVKLKDSFTAGGLYADSANAYKKVDMKKAGTMLDLAVKVQIENNRLGQAARLVKEFADALEEQGAGLQAIPYYEKAMQFFNAEDQKTQSHNCMVAMGKIYGENDDFDKALMYYERVANNMVDGPLKFQAQDYYVRAMLCRFAMVTNDNRFEKGEECREALQRYLATDMYLRNTREAEFLDLMLEAVCGSDPDKFEQGVSLLQDLRKLDDWKTHALLVVKHNMESLA